MCRSFLIQYGLMLFLFWDLIQNLHVLAIFLLYLDDVPVGLVFALSMSCSQTTDYIYC